jgi:aconitate hydratase A / 2-methylisocitrate dehydratase
MTSALRDACEREIDLGLGSKHRFYSLPALERAGLGKISRLPLSLRVVLESLVRNCDGKLVSEQQVRDLADWQPNARRESEIPFTVGRIVLNCAAGIPLLGDLTAIRGAVMRHGCAASSVEPKVPVDMVLDHTLTVDFHGTPDALARNMELEISRNAERFGFVKWAMQAYKGIRLFPPGAGILHQVNLEYLAPGILFRDGVCFPDTLVGTDSHTGMIAGLGVVGWGVGGIEAETAMLGQPVYFLTPDVVGVNITGALKPGVTATDLVLHITELLRRSKVVGKFVEFFGAGVRNLTLPDRATIANMSPEYGATIGFFPVDEQTCRYLRQTARSEQQVKAVETYFRAQGCFGAPMLGEVDYTAVIDLDLDSVEPCLAGPKRPQDLVRLSELRVRFEDTLRRPVSAGGYDVPLPMRPAAAVKVPHQPEHGDVVIAAITSCTNTSNPGVMVMAGLVAKKAVERGLTSKPWVKTSFTPGSRVVSKYLEAAGLQGYLDALGFNVAGYSCGTCVGASGPIDANLEKNILDNDLVACAVLSGNRNFESRIHPAVRAAFLASPPLVVVFALTGSVNIDVHAAPLGTGKDGEDVYLRDLWPSPEEIANTLAEAARPAFYSEAYGGDIANRNPLWRAIPLVSGELYPWDNASSYIKEPPFLDREARRSVLKNIVGARALAILGNSVTTDHISPIGSIKATSPAGLYLRSLGVAQSDFNNYGARRMNHEVMIRGAFSNLQLKNFMVRGVEGGVTLHQPDGERLSIYDAAMLYRSEQVPLIVIAGEEYGTGSARDWAAKASRLLGVRAVIASSFERIHRSNLAGMGVLPCQFAPGMNADKYALDGSEAFDLVGLDEHVKPGAALTLVVRRISGDVQEIPLTLRLDTQMEIDYVRRGGIMPYVLNELTKGTPAHAA